MPGTPWSPITLTPQQAAANQAIISANAIPRAWTRGYNAVYGNPDPAGVVAAMGTNAVSIFAGSAVQAQAFNTMGLNTSGVTGIADGSPYPTTIPAGFTFTANADGSAVLTVPTQAQA